MHEEIPIGVMIGIPGAIPHGIAIGIPIVIPIIRIGYETFRKPKFLLFLESINNPPLIKMSRVLSNDQNQNGTILFKDEIRLLKLIVGMFSNLSFFSPLTILRLKITSSLPGIIFKAFS